jgi:hypothetical protein
MGQSADDNIFSLFCLASEFSRVTVRPEGEVEVVTLLSRVPIPVHKAPDQPSAKFNILLPLCGFLLMADSAQNAASS